MAALGWILFQPAQTYSVILMPTGKLDGAHVLVGRLGMRSKLRSASVWNPWLWMGLLIGIVTMMVATILFLVPLVIAAIFHEIRAGGALRARPSENSRGVRAAHRRRGGRVVAVRIAQLPSSFSEPVFLSAHGGLNFFIGNNPDANGYTKIPPVCAPGRRGCCRIPFYGRKKPRDGN